MESVDENGATQALGRKSCPVTTGVVRKSVETPYVTANHDYRKQYQPPLPRILSNIDETDSKPHLSGFSMSEPHTETAENPFHSPTMIDPESISLPPDQNYRVVEDTLVCRKDVSLENICGVTGDTENVVTTRMIRKSVTPNWVYTLLAIPVMLVAISMSVIGDADTVWSLTTAMIFLSPFYLFFVGRYATKSIFFTTGLSERGQRLLRKNRFARSLTWGLCLFVLASGVCVIRSYSVPSGIYMDVETGEVYSGVGEFGLFGLTAEVTFFAAVTLLVVGATLVKVILRPQAYRPTVRILPSGLFALTGLPRPVLCAAEESLNAELGASGA